ncbi:Uncharacterized protein OBRU01_20868 [Operophtera brumata]|uniref:Uncharacterized protein n=1 Tax=Operophtera brumata TaxID=104452 RepID=A0A0L7KTY5_OPEBR|nr:Uncharacterized protein OBRU01_20868 [Operophtera brumata]
MDASLQDTHHGDRGAEATRQDYTDRLAHVAVLQRDNTSRVSLLRLQIDNGQWTHTKSSGLCVTTGTGSTSWHYR